MFTRLLFPGKKQILRAVLGLGLSIYSLISFGQLNGNYTIGTSGDFTGFNEAMTAIVDAGINGDVVFQVQPGVYLERVLLNFDGVTFSSTDISVSFIGQGASPEDVLIIYQSAGSETDYTMKVDGGQNLLFRNMKFQNRGLVYANVVGIGLDSYVEGITFDNCHFQGTDIYLDDTFPTSLYFESGTNNITVTNTIHQGSNYGITCWSGTSNILLSDNQLYEQHIQAMSLSVSNALIERNYIEKLVDIFDQYNYGIEIWQGNDFIVRSNQLNLNVSKIAGLALNDDFTISNDYNIVERNEITGQDLNNGIRLSGSANSLIRNNYTSLNDVKFGLILTDSDNSHIVQNTFKMNSEGDLLVVVSGEDITCFNNIMINYGEGTVYASLTSFESDYNFVYTAGEEFSSDDDTFELHQLESGQDANSISFFLEFPNETRPEICHYAIADAGIDLRTIADDNSLADEDFYGTVRNQANPEIGAYEFELPTTVIFSADTVEICEGTEITIAPENTFVDHLWLNDSSTQSSITVDSINTYQLQVVDMEGCILFDSVHLDVQLVEVDLGEDQNICLGNTITLESQEGLSSYLWSTGDTTSTLDVTQPGTYSVVIANELGCSDEDEIVIDLSSDTFDPNFLVSNIGCTSDTIQFAEVSEFEPDALLWDFGDGNTSEEKHPSHQYDAVGDYLVTMTATLGECGLTEEKEVVITSTCMDFLMAYYPLDTGANDISEQEYHGTIIGDLAFVDDPERGSVAAFDGVDDYIELTTSGALDLANSSFTVSAWVKFNTIEGMLPVLGNTVAVDNQGLNLGVQDGRTHLSFFNNDLTGKQQLVADTWNFITYSYDLESQTMTIYVNGERDAILAEKEAFTSLDLVTIGLAQSNFFTGYLDDLRIWREALTDEEIYENWSGYSTELVAHYELTHSASDVSGNGFDGEASGNIAFVEDADRGLVAHLGGGSKDYITLTNADSLSITESSFVVSAWIKVATFDKNDLTILGSVNHQDQRRGLYLLTRGQNPHMGFGGNDTRATNTTLNENEWYHLTFLYNQVAQHQSIYVNGQLVAENENRGTYLGTQTLLIGNSINFRKGMNGFISDLKIRKIKDANTAGKKVTIEEVENDDPVEMILYPNPSVDFVNLQITYSETYEGTITLHDLRGNKLIYHEIGGFGEVQELLDLEGITEGVYILKLRLNDKEFSKRLLIRH